ncbi:MAG: ribonuclease HI family protein [Sporolactobacillus sp.]|nr:ribonuclease HI family protein [Sporolactobacillus sp.]
MQQVYFDGASAGNPGISGCGLYIPTSNGQDICRSFPLGIKTSNHEAEFAALIQAVGFCLDRHFTAISLRTDSQLIVQSLEQGYVKRKIFARYLEQALELSLRFNLFFCKWIPDRENKNADRLARAAIFQQQKARDGQ